MTRYLFKATLILSRSYCRLSANGIEAMGPARAACMRGQSRLSSGAPRKHAQKGNHKAQYVATAQRDRLTPPSLILTALAEAVRRSPWPHPPLMRAVQRIAAPAPSHVWQRAIAERTCAWTVSARTAIAVKLNVGWMGGGLDGRVIPSAADFSDSSPGGVGANDADLSRRTHAPAGLDVGAPTSLANS
ncbi:hypothetical protein WOLCODRAFT_159008 [Wolfiporia cocos MD-104 SS10]|uniref:Uncharacterized protein n=1 Tax=Wolfiporia cocos (strain MD-104) TaxID=742152 RepID=A0A2H3JKX7_WOLCO|nr:hypothetical protein WOLCODRAFT_159008 [Wolfiporia cocos MD-104 SS10]